MASISTKGGDKGQTSLFDGTRVYKASLRPEVYGTLDEVSSFVGLARSRSRNPELQALLLKLQNLIYLANAELACPPEAVDRLPKRFSPADLQWLEETSSHIEEGLQLPPRFILYGAHEISALLDVARAVTRWAERALVRLDTAEPIANPEVKAFINRLSDTLYLLARQVEKQEGTPAPHPD